MKPTGPHRCGANDWGPSGEKWRCRPCSRAARQRQRHAAPHGALHGNAWARARESGVPCEITVEDVRRILEQSGWACVYCEQPLGSYTGRARANSATLDRLVTELGYTRRNTVVACHRCNASKGEHTPATLRAWADRIEAVINRQSPNEEV